jgi:hypothetical protein
MIMTDSMDVVYFMVFGYVPLVVFSLGVLESIDRHKNKCGGK